MTTTTPTTPPRLSATYTTWAAVSRDAMSLRQGAFLKTSTALAQFAQIDVQFELPEGDPIMLRGEVVSVVPDTALAVQWRPEARDGIEQLLTAAMQHVADVAGAGADEPHVAALDDDAAPDDDEHVDENAFPDRASLQAQLETMSVNDKRQHALHGKKDMRWLLIRDQNKTLHPFVMKNPAITLDEVEQIARLTSVNPDVLHTIAHNRDWTKSQNVVRNLVKNPKTPMPDALLLVDKLPISDVRAMAKSSGVRGPIQQLCRKKVTG